MTKEPTIQDVLSAVQDLSVHIDRQFVEVRQEAKGLRQDMNREFVEVRGEIKEIRADMGQMKSDLMTEIDRFVVLHQTLDVELVSLRSRCDRMETFMVQVATHLNLNYNKL